MGEEKNLNVVLFKNENDIIINEAIKEALKEIKKILEPIINFLNNLEEEEE